MIRHTKKPPEKGGESIAFTLSVYNGYIEGSSNEYCWEVTFSKMQHIYLYIPTH